jgi:tryptophan 2,3-dioxygenase
MVHRSTTADPGIDLTPNGHEEKTMNKRELEPGIHTELDGELTYSGYLDLGRLLNAQHPLSQPPHHDEMLFIIQHQTAELWFKLILHELGAATAYFQRDDFAPCSKIFARVKQVQQQLFNQWAVLETLTPSEYAEFRGVLGHASGFQSFQYRKLEFLLGNKEEGHVKVFRHEPVMTAELERILRNPGLYDEFLRSLARRGFAVPEERVERDWSQPYEAHPAVVDVLRTVYEDPSQYWEIYDVCEKLVDIEQNFQIWRFRHLKNVERIIGFKPGTGGSSGVDFLRRAVDIRLFPELIMVRTYIDN